MRRVGAALAPRAALYRCAGRAAAAAEQVGLRREAGEGWMEGGEAGGAACSSVEGSRDEPSPEFAP